MIDSIGSGNLSHVTDDLIYTSTNWTNPQTLTADDYHQFIAAGIIKPDTSIELLNGQTIESEY